MAKRGCAKREAKYRAHAHETSSGCWEGNAGVCWLACVCCIWVEDLVLHVLTPWSAVPVDEQLLAAPACLSANLLLARVMWKALPAAQPRPVTAGTTVAAAKGSSSKLVVGSGGKQAAAPGVAVDALAGAAGSPFWSGCTPGRRCRNSCAGHHSSAVHTEAPATMPSAASYAQMKGKDAPAMQNRSVFRPQIRRRACHVTVEVPAFDDGSA